MVEYPAKSTSSVERSYRLIHDIYVLLDAGDRHVLEPFGLTASQFRILNLLATEPHWRLIDLSNAILCARSTVTRIVDGLETAGLVRRLDHPVDRRSQRVTLTPEGRNLLARALKAHTQSLEERLGMSDAVSQESLIALLQAIRARLVIHLEQVSASNAKN